VFGFVYLKFSCGVNVECESGGTETRRAEVISEEHKGYRGRRAAVAPKEGRRREMLPGGPELKMAGSPPAPTLVPRPSPGDGLRM